MSKSLLPLLCISLILGGCARSGDQVWDDTVSCSRHVGRGFQSLCGGTDESRQVRSTDDFWCSDDDMLNYHLNPMWDEYDTQMITASDLESPTKKSVPNIAAFSDPSNDPQLAKLFRKLHFDYNSNLVKGKENTETLRLIADYMKKNPGAYIYVEGHCDKRGPEAYNLALGSRRSNEVKTYLVKEGVDAERVLTVSYGKERILATGNDENAHKQNRRAEFKLYEK